jgi:hypothetical protein
MGAVLSHAYDNGQHQCTIINNNDDIFGDGNSEHDGERDSNDYDGDANSKNCNIKEPDTMVGGDGDDDGNDDVGHDYVVDDKSDEDEEDDKDDKNIKNCNIKEPDTMVGGDDDDGNDDVGHD